MAEYDQAVEIVKKKARARADYLIRRGRIVKPLFCERCGREGFLESHHQDYGAPEEVLFWCVSCHRRFHRGLSRRTVFEFFPGPDIIDHGTDAEDGANLK